MDVFIILAAKRLPMFRYATHTIAILLAVIFFACGPSKTVSFNITQPAEITLPAEANTILLVDRTKFKDKTLNTIEGILTGELPADDKAAAQEALNSLKMKMENSPRFAVKIHPERLT